TTARQGVSNHTSAVVTNDTFSFSLFCSKNWVDRTHLREDGVRNVCTDELRKTEIPRIVCPMMKTALRWRESSALVVTSVGKSVSQVLMPLSCTEQVIIAR